MSLVNGNASLKKAGDLFRSGSYEEAKFLYCKLYSISNGIIKSQIKFNLNLIDRKIRKSINNDKKLSYELNCNRFYIENDEIEKDLVFVGVASIPQRVKSLEKMIDSLLPQVDEIGVFLDGYESIPDFLKNNKKIKYSISQDYEKKIGDAGKFIWVDGFSGFYFTADDDLIYPVDYIERTKKRIISYKKPIVIGWHGSVLLEPFNDYYNSSSRRVFSFGASRPYDTPVHILGTGCLGFHTSHIKVSFNDFNTPNMADVYFAKLGQEQNIPFSVIKHAKNEILEAPDTRSISIYQHSHEGKKNSLHNTKEMQNSIVKSLSWSINYFDDYLHILIIGRFNINKKGGVYKSSHLLKDYLMSIGHKVTICCLSEVSNLSVNVNDFDFSIVYAPDPERPDFSNCLGIIETLIKNNTICAVNFSFNLDKKRTNWISKKLDELNEGYKKPRCFFASFSNSTSLVFDDVYKDRIVTFPKTISLQESNIENIPFSEREGIFLGDLAKLSNSKLTHGNVLKWLEQIRINLPHVNIYALKHYHTDVELANYIKIIPYTNEIEKILTKFRLCINLTPGATFEMVPVEAMICGTPVIHRKMPQSLSEYLSPNSIEVNSPDELGEICKRLYENEFLWSKLSKSGKAMGDFLKIDNVISSIDMSIRKCLLRGGIRNE